MRKILINGNMGYIGPIVVNHYRKHYPEAQIVGFDMGYFGGCLVEPNFFPESKVDIQYFGDIRNFPKKILEGVDAVIQLAAISNDPMGKSFEEPTKEINSDSAISVASLSKEMGVKNFVFASSCSVYGAAGSDAKKENSELNPQTAYAKSKINSEIGLRLLADDNFTVTALRFATACGFSPRFRLDLVLNDFVASAIWNKKIEILSDGSPLRPLIHVQDMARAIDWASNRTSNNGGAFLVVNTGSNDWNFRIKELAEQVQHVCNDIVVSINPHAVSDNRSYKVDFDLFKQLAPEYLPKLSLSDAIEDIIAGLVKMNFTGNNFRDSQFIRLKTLSYLIETNQIDNKLNWTKF